MNQEHVVTSPVADNTGSSEKRFAECKASSFPLPTIPGPSRLQHGKMRYTSISSVAIELAAANHRVTTFSAAICADLVWSVIQVCYNIMV